MRKEKCQEGGDEFQRSQKFQEWEPIDNTGPQKIREGEVCYTAEAEDTL